VGLAADAGQNAEPGLAAGAGGFLGAVLGPRPTLWIAAVGGTAGFAVLLPSPLPGFRLPSPQGEGLMTAGSPQRTATPGSR
jgi:hypothetical protein